MGSVESLETEFSASNPMRVLTRDGYTKEKVPRVKCLEV